MFHSSDLYQTFTEKEQHANYRTKYKYRAFIALFNLYDMQSLVSDKPYRVTHTEYKYKTRQGLIGAVNQQRQSNVNLKEPVAAWD